MKLTIYHNPRCRKSREALHYLEENDFEVEVVRYLDHPIKSSELELIYDQLGDDSALLIRKNESHWKENYKGKTLTKKQQIQLLIEHPKLMERPIISNGKKAVIARPLEKIHQILN